MVQLLLRHNSLNDAEPVGRSCHSYGGGQSWQPTLAAAWPRCLPAARQKLRQWHVGPGHLLEEREPSRGPDLGGIGPGHRSDSLSLPGKEACIASCLPVSRVVLLRMQARIV